MQIKRKHSFKLGTLIWRKMEFSFSFGIMNNFNETFSVASLFLFVWRFLHLFQTEICSSALTDVIHAVINGTDGCLFCFGHAGLGESIYDFQDTKSSLELTLVSGDFSRRTSNKKLVKHFSWYRAGWQRLLVRSFPSAHCSTKSVVPVDKTPLSVPRTELIPTEHGNNYMKYEYHGEFLVVLIVLLLSFPSWYVRTSRCICSS